MPRGIFDQDLRAVQDDLLVLGSMVESALTDAVRSLKYRDRDRSQSVIHGDRRVNEKRFAIESTALELIATQQPMARDLRTLAAVLEIATELERIGDYAKGIARINLMLNSAPLFSGMFDLPRMADIAGSMLHRALDAFVQRDVDLARAISDQDDEVDELYKQVYRALMTQVATDQERVEESNLLLWAAHNLERAADRVTNICERTVFTVTGQMIEMDVEESIESLG